MKKTLLSLRFSAAALCLCLILGLFAACGRATVDPSKELTKGVQATSVLARKTDATFTETQMRFCVELFKAAASEKGENILLSPFSVSLALAMTLNGAEGNTKTQMENILCGGFDRAALNEYLHTYTAGLPNGEKARLVPANSVWFCDDGRIEVKKDFLQTVKDYFSSEVFKETFDDLIDDKINSWVDEKTEGMIKKLIEEVDPDTVMFLVNALTFDAEWKDIYDEYATREGLDFTNADGKVVKADYMYSGEDVYITDGSAEGFIKPYKGGRFAFAALLPKEGMPIDEYIKGLTAEGLAETLENKKTAIVTAATPKFKSEYGISLVDVLKALGMPDAFEPGIADFTSMADSEVGQLYIGDVIHKTFIEVDERGTKAGAATAVVMKAESAMDGEIHNITLDRPFVYMIVDTENNIPIFIGALTNME